MLTRLIGSAVLLAVILGVSFQGIGYAQDAAKVKRSHYAVKHGDAKELARVLTKHFKDEAEVQAVEGSNALLVRATPDITEEISKLLAALDRKERVVAVELIVVETFGKADEKAVDEKALSGPEKTVLEKVAELKKMGAVSAVKRFQFTALEGSPAAITIGVSQAYTTGMAGGGGGAFKGKGGFPAPATRSVSYRDVGTLVKVTARVSDDRSVILDVDFSDSSVRESKDSPVLGTDDNGVPIRAPEFVRSSFKSKLTVPLGRAVAAKDIETTGKSDTARTLIIAIARIVEPARGGK
jgi:hypothetical protein